MSLDNDLAALLPQLRRYARALTGDAAWADDLVQDTAERALSQSARLRSHGNLRAWLLTVLRHLYIDQLRRQREIPWDEHDARWQQLEAPEGQIDGLLLGDVQRALYQLPLEQREVLLLVVLEQMRYEDAAAVLRVPVGTVMSRLSRAREHLRSLVGEQATQHPPTLRAVKDTP